MAPLVAIKCQRILVRVTVRSVRIGHLPNQKHLLRTLILLDRVKVLPIFFYFITVKQLWRHEGWVLYNFAAFLEMANWEREGDREREIYLRLQYSRVSQVNVTGIRRALIQAVRQCWSNDAPSLHQPASLFGQYWFRTKRAVVHKSLHWWSSSSCHYCVVAFAQQCTTLFVNIL